MSGAVNNAPQLKILLNQNVIRWVIENILTKGRYKTAEECKWPFLSWLISGLAWNSLWSTSAGLRMAGLKYISKIRPGVIGLGVMRGLGTVAAWIQVSAP